MRSALVVVVVMAGCRADRKPENRHEPVVAPGHPQALTNPSGPVKADALIKQALDLRKDLAPWRIQASYVRSDGVFDPTYGELEVNLIGQAPPQPPDDPNRPTGAPVPDPDPNAAKGPDCEDFRWTASSGWAPRQDDYMKMCIGMGGQAPLHCTAIQIWQRALADGAPANALAKIDAMAAMGWSSSIDDDPRNVHFSQTYRDDCPPAAEAGPP
jgi:hypothetical protein